MPQCSRFHCKPTLANSRLAFLRLFDENKIIQKRGLFIFPYVYLFLSPLLSCCTAGSTKTTNRPDTGDKSVVSPDPYPAPDQEEEIDSSYASSEELTALLHNNSTFKELPPKDQQFLEKLLPQLEAKTLHALNTYFPPPDSPEPNKADTLLHPLLLAQLACKRWEPLSKYPLNLYTTNQTEWEVISCFNREHEKFNKELSSAKKALFQQSTSQEQAEALFGEDLTYTSSNNTFLYTHFPTPFPSNGSPIQPASDKELADACIATLDNMDPAWKGSLYLKSLNWNNLERRLIVEYMYGNHIIQKGQKELGKFYLAWCEETRQSEGTSLPHLSQALDTIQEGIRGNP